MTARNMKLVVHSNSPLFDTFQIGDRNNPLQFMLKDTLGNHAKEFKGISETACYRINNYDGLVIIVLKANDGNNIAFADSQGNLGIRQDCISQSTVNALKAFICAATGELVDVRKAAEINPWPDDYLLIGTSPVYLIVSVGMLNKALKQAKHDELRVGANSAKEYAVQKVFANGNVSNYFISSSMRDITKYLISNGYISIDQLRFMNQPSEINKYFRKEVGRIHH